MILMQVTADGSFNCADNPGEQEAAVAQLLYCEAVSALLLLKAGGSFVLKTFTTLECHTLCLMYLLTCCFDEVNVWWMWRYSCALHCGSITACTYCMYAFAFTCTCTLHYTCPTTVHVCISCLEK